MTRFLAPVFLFSMFSLMTYAGDTTETYLMSGTMFTTHASSGGAFRVDEPLLQPAGFVMLYVVRWTGENQIPTIVDSVLTDETGRFGVRLPPGNYGILAIRDTKNPDPGQWLPKSRESHFDDGQTTDWWEISTHGPITLLSGDATGIVLTHHFRTYCYTCP